MRGNGLIIILTVVAIAIAGVAGFLIFQNMEDSETDTTEESEMTDDMTNETSMLSDLPDNSDTQSVELTDLGVSFFVPNDVTETTSPTIYKKYQNVAECAYVGQDEEQLLVVAYETGSDCVLDADFESTGTRAVGESTLATSTRTGRSGDVLNLETVDLGNGVSMGFFYKTQFEVPVQAEVDEILSSFEIEIAN